MRKVIVSEICERAAVCIVHNNPRKTSVKMLSMKAPFVTMDSCIGTWLNAVPEILVDRDD